MRVVIIAAVVGLIVWRVDWGGLASAFTLTAWPFLLVAVAANFLSVVLKGWAWKGVLDALPQLTHRIRLRDVLSPIMVGFLFNTVLAARIGEIAKVLLAKRRLARRGDDVPTTTLIGTVVAETLISTLAWAMLVVFIGLFLPLPNYAWITIAVVGAACLMVVVVALLRSPGRSVPPWLSTGPLWARISRAVHRLWAGVRESHIGLRRPRRMAVVVLASLGTWLAQWVGIYSTLVAFGLQSVGWGGAGLLLVTVTLAQTFPVLPGNLLVFQAAAVVPLTASYGVSGADALAFAVVLQATEVVIGVIVGFVFLLFEGVSFSQLRREAEAEEQRQAGEDTTVTA